MQARVQIIHDTQQAVSTSQKQTATHRLHRDTYSPLVRGTALVVTLGKLQGRRGCPLLPGYRTIKGRLQPPVTQDSLGLERCGLDQPVATSQRFLALM